MKNLRTLKLALKLLAKAEEELLRQPEVDDKTLDIIEILEEAYDILVEVYEDLEKTNPAR